MIFYTSDLHFGHRNSIDFDNRPVSDVEEMDAWLIKNWNAKVCEKDEVYILGDFAYRNKKPFDWYLQQLKGRKHLIIGNHDGEMLKSDTAMGYFDSVEKMQHVVDGGRHICLCHFPLAEWNGSHRGSWHIYGHIHAGRTETYSFMKAKEKALNAGCMINNYAPVTLEELIRNNKKFREEM